MKTPITMLERSHDVSQRVAQILHTRPKLAIERVNERVHAASAREVATLSENPISLARSWTDGTQYFVDLAQRSVLFADAAHGRCGDGACGSGRSAAAIRATRTDERHFAYDSPGGGD